MEVEEKKLEIKTEPKEEDDSGPNGTTSSSPSQSRRKSEFVSREGRLLSKYFSWDRRKHKSYNSNQETHNFSSAAVPIFNLYTLFRYLFLICLSFFILKSLSQRSCARL